MINIFDALHYLFTGVRLSELLDDPINIGTAGTGVLDGVTVFAGLDRLAADMSDSKYPFLVIEPGGQTQSYEAQGKEVTTINIGFSVLVPGQQGALIGRVDTAEAGILDWLQTVKNLVLENDKLMLDGSSVTCRADSISVEQFAGSDDNGVIYTRSFELSVIYSGTNWIGQ